MYYISHNSVQVFSNHPTNHGKKLKRMFVLRVNASANNKRGGNRGHVVVSRLQFDVNATLNL